MRGGEDGARSTPRRFEIVVARLWNVINEGKPFTPVFTLGILLLLSAAAAGVDGAYWLRAALRACRCWRRCSLVLPASTSR